MEAESASGYGKRRDTVFFVLCVTVAAWQCFYVALDTHLGGLGNAFHEWRALAVAIANALVLISPFWLLSPRWRGLVWIPLSLLTLWCLIQVCYFRAYDDLMPLRSLLMTGNVNKMLVGSTVALLRWKDLLIVAPVLFLLLLLRPTLKSSLICVNRLKAYAATLLAALLFGAVGYATPDGNYEKRFLYNFSNSDYFALNGLIPYCSYSLYQAVAHNHTVTDAERADIDRFLHDQCPKYSDNRFCAEPLQRNLVLIVVESLHTWPIGMEVEGREVTPTLNRLIAAEGTIYAPHLLFQTGHGHSSDAHFIYNTGLLPLRDDVVAVYYGDGPYPSLASALSGYDSRMAVCDEKHYWNQSVTSQTYGFDSLYCHDHLAARGALQRHSDVDDAALTDFAATLLPQMHQPFFLEMVTMTMHTPYPRDKVRHSWILDSDTLNAEERSYLNCVNLTDSCIGAFIDVLRLKGMDGNTVVAIVSDHTQLYRNRIMGKTDYDAVPDDWGIPMIITGSDTTLRYEPIIGQVDVFPTLLDVMGANAYPWKGLGHSLLRYDVRSAIQPRNMSVLGDSTALTLQQRQAWDISRLLILDRSNYFKQ